MTSPLTNIKDGYDFQQIVAEYFRSLKHEKNDFHIADIHVEDNGIGGDDGCDILVEFVFEDPIYKHSQKWVIECKSQKKPVGQRDINSNNIDSIIRANGANGYLLICMKDASTSLKRLFKGYNENNHYKYVIWNGNQLWHKFIKSLSLIKAFFPEYYLENFEKNGAINDYNEYVAEYSKKFNLEGK